MRWLLSHHRPLLNVVERRSEISPEEAILRHLQTGYDAPPAVFELCLQETEGRRLASKKSMLRIPWIRLFDVQVEHQTWGGSR
jgi:hypothetical protein